MNAKTAAERIENIKFQRSILDVHKLIHTNRE